MLHQRRRETFFQSNPACSRSIAYLTRMCNSWNRRLSPSGYRWRIVLLYGERSHATFVGADLSARTLDSSLATVYTWNSTDIRSAPSSLSLHLTSSGATYHVPYPNYLIQKLHINRLYKSPSNQTNTPVPMSSTSILHFCRIRIKPPAKTSQIS